MYKPPKYPWIPPKKLRFINTSLPNRLEPKPVRKLKSNLLDMDYISTNKNFTIFIQEFPYSSFNNLNHCLIELNWDVSERTQHKMISHTLKEIIPDEINTTILGVLPSSSHFSYFLFVFSLISKPYLVFYKR